MAEHINGSETGSDDGDDGVQVVSTPSYTDGGLSGGGLGDWFSKFFGNSSHSGHSGSSVASASSSHAEDTSSHAEDSSSHAEDTSGGTGSSGGSGDSSGSGGSGDSSGSGGGGPDGIVQGTDGNDVMLPLYEDADGDKIDAGDALLPGEFGDDDIIKAGKGDDIVDAGEGNDEVSGGSGNDTLQGGAGDDQIDGGKGDDTIGGGAGSDELSGGSGQDTFTDLGAGDTVDGGSGGTDFDVLDLTGSAPGGSFTVVEDGPDSNGNGVDGHVDFFDGDGNSTGTLEFEEIEKIVICFTPGSMIATPRGEVPVETLKVGDKVLTRDNGAQEIRWVGSRRMDGQSLLRLPHLNPVLIRAGSLGEGLPERDMMVSPNHRMLVADERATLYFDEREVLVAAKHMAGRDGVHQFASTGVTYVHLMFDNHEVILANGTWSESFQPGDYSLKGIGDAQRDEIFELFPELKKKAGLQSYGAARRTLKRYEARLLTR